jgi:two-component system chemotaxis response regulator CheB
MKGQYKMIVIGASAGGLTALESILARLPEKFPVSIVIVQHLLPTNDSILNDLLNRHCALSVKEAEDKEPIKSGVVYTAPANYHLLIEPDFSFALNVDLKVNFSRPSIDALFDSASECYQSQLIGVLLTGANEDGAQGLSKIQNNGGLVIVQDPATAEVATMPAAGLELTQTPHVLALEGISDLIMEVCCHD